ncbi:TPA: hypothetical protein HA231_00265 [Candidatus Woesearchaeota archaeon]|nr:hypothetical protein [Candidatus Woesearchaeota archaeon]
MAKRKKEGGSELPRLMKGDTSAFFKLLKKQAVEGLRNARHALTLKNAVIAAFAISMLLIFGSGIKDILLVAVLGTAASYSTIYKRTIRVPSAVELVTLGTVVTGAAYGPLVGAAFGIITTIASEIISSGVDVFTLFYATARGISGAVAFYAVNNWGFGMVAMGMTALVIFHAISDFIYIVSGDVEAKLKVVYFTITNTAFNLLVFTLFGKLLLRLATM